VRVRVRIEDSHSYSDFYSNPPPKLGKGAVPQTRAERVRVRVRVRIEDSHSYSDFYSSPPPPPN
jgi:hypothetical protein